jgi:hypothetical protein
MDIFDTIVLVQTVPNLKLAQNFLLDTFFPGIVTSDDEFVAIDVDVGKRRMSPFVSPLVAGKLVEGRKIQTNVFKPAYIKDKRALDLRRPVRRQIGERIGGEMSAAEREQANLMFEMADQVDMLNRRLEWMAASALAAGKVTVSGDGYPTTVVDFQRDSGLSITLGTGETWGATGVLPVDDIEAWATLILKKSGGVATDIVFTPKAWKLFLSIPDSRVQQTVWYAGAGGAGNALNVGTQIKRGAQFKGVWGQYNLWLYNDWYVDDNDVEQPMLVDGTVVMAGGDLMGTRAFGCILDPDFAYGPMPYAPKSWTEKDPAGRFLMMQSAPLVIPSRVNASLGVLVA